MEPVSHSEMIAVLRGMLPPTEAAIRRRAEVVTAIIEYLVEDEKRLELFYGLQVEFPK